MLPEKAPARPMGGKEEAKPEMKRNTAFTQRFQKQGGGWLRRLVLYVARVVLPESSGNEWRKSDGRWIMEVVVRIIKTV